MLLSLLSYYSGDPYSYSNNYAYTDRESLSAIVAILMGYIVVISIISLVTGILQLIGMWKTNKKMGEPGWACLVPFYNIYVIAKNCSSIKNFKMLMTGYIITILSSSIASLIGDAGIMLFASLISLAGSVIVLVYNIKIMIGLSNCFGYSGAFVLGLIFLPYIFYMILGCGKAQYEGNSEDCSVNYQDKASYYGGYSAAGYNNYSNNNSYNSYNRSNGMNNGYQNNSYSNNMNSGYQNNSYSNNMNNGYQNNSSSNGMYGAPQNGFNNGMNNGYTRPANNQPKDMADLAVPTVDDASFEQYERNNGRKPNNDNFMNGI